VRSGPEALPTETAPTAFERSGPPTGSSRDRSEPSTPAADALARALADLSAGPARWSFLALSGEARRVAEALGTKTPERVKVLSASRAASFETIFPGDPSDGRLVVGSRPEDAVAAYLPWRRALAATGPRPIWVAWSSGDVESTGFFEDIAALTALPGVSLVVPSDRASLGRALTETVERPESAYVRLPSGLPDRVGDAPFRLGAARVLRDGDAVTIGALGATVPFALDLAGELQRIGLEARVLDFASLRPFDVKATVRAARETQAFVTIEDRSLVHGLGSLIATVTAESVPVPVHRLGVPEVLVPTGAGEQMAQQAVFSRQRALDEIWAILRQGGKVQ
jgi:hypothetical protein